MRSHAKASSAGSNSDRGESRRLLRRSGALAAVLVALVAAACLLPGSASAIEFRTLTSKFGPNGTEGTSFSEYLGPLAFDQGNKHLYALDSEAQEIYGFDASTPGSHTPLGSPFPLAAPSASFEEGIAVDSSSHHVYFASRSGHTLYGFDESGNALPGFPIGGLGNVCGVAVDPSGNVWVAEGSSKRVSKFNSAGVETQTVPMQGAAELPCSIAVDGNENLFLADGYGKVVEYPAGSEYEAASSKVIDPGFAYAIALDHSTNELYVVHYESIAVYGEEGTLQYEFGENVPGAEYYGEFGGIAIDEASGEAFVSDYGHHKVDVFGPPLSLPKTSTEGADGITASGATVHGTINPRGLAVEECHFEVIPAEQFIETKYEHVTAGEKFPCVPAAGSIPVDANPHAVSAAVTGLNPATVYHYRLAAKNSIGEGHGFDRQFTTGPASPLVEEESVEAVGTTEATVAAKINPRGGETTYHLEYGTTGAYGQSSEESPSFGFPSDSGRHAVSVHVGGLTPGTAYHFRFVATNEVATADGADSTFATYPANPSFAPCPNDAFRTGAGSRLPDCRAYEQSTPIDKNGANAQVFAGSVSPSGERFTFVANGGLPTTGGLSNLVPFLASRGPGGWGFDGLLPLTNAGFNATVIGANEDLSTTLVVGEGPGGVGKQLFLRDSETASFQPGPVIPEGFFPTLVGFAAGASHVAFLGEKQFLPSALEGKPNLYDLDHGTLTLVDRVPAGSATSCDDEAGPACVVPAEGTTYGQLGQKISRDGSLFFFTSDPTKRSFNTGRIYMREDGARTTWISASQRTTPDPGGEKPAELVGITSDGSKAFFLSCEKLTDDSTAHSNGENTCTGSSQGRDLYVYDVETGNLTDLTVDSNVGDPLGAGVQNASQGAIVGASEDGSYIYFFADGVLAPGASNSNCQNFEAKCNLYVYHDGATTFIAQTQIGFFEHEVSGDGSALLFNSALSLTGYNNVGVCTQFGSKVPCPIKEFFRYNAPEEKLLCVTCPPTGLPPTGFPSLFTAGSALGTGSVGGPVRNLSADGNRVFFESPDAMVPGDTNGARDVYEWEAKGEGSCESASQNGGCIYLISSGTDPESSYFLGASKNGDGVFFFTEQQLVPTDQDQLVDVYDARVDGGLASQHTLTPPTCSTTACQENPPPPQEQTPASATFTGPGDAHPRSSGRKCPRGTRKVDRKGKVSCRKAPRQHKRHHNRGGSK